MIFSRSPGEKPPVRASSAKRSRMALREDMRGIRNVIVDADQMTTTRNARRRKTSFRLKTKLSAKLAAALPGRGRREAGRASVDARPLFQSFKPRGRLHLAACRLVITSMPVCAQNAPLVPIAKLVAVGQLVQ